MVNFKVVKYNYMQYNYISAQWTRTGILTYTTQELQYVKKKNLLIISNKIITVTKENNKYNNH